MKTFLFIILSITGISLFAQKQLGTDTIRINVTVPQAKTIVDTNVGNPDFIILDVRQPSEYGNAHIANAININYYDANFSAELDALDHNKMYLLHCASGGRSTPTFAMMQTKHFREVYHMNNGLNAWIGLGYPTVSGYTSLQKESVTKLTALYPNPATYLLNIQYESDVAGKLFLINIHGQNVLEENLISGLQSFDISELPSGIYIAKIQSTERIITNKITIL